MKGSVAVRHLGQGQGLHHHDTHHHFPATPMAVDSLHHHHANNHNSHQHMARVKAGVAARTSSSSFASSTSSGGAAADTRHTASSTTSSSGGGTGGRPASSERLTTPAVSERLTPRRFLDKYSLPRVVRVVADSGRSKQPMSGPLAQPLLLYRHYTSCKVLARSLRRPGDKVASKAASKAARHSRDDKHAQHEPGTGPPLVIPDSYQGWFSLVRERSLQTRAKLYTSIQQLVNARVAVFLSKGSLTGFKLAHAPSPGVDGDMAGMGLSGRRLQYARSTVRGGQVLRLLAVFEDNESGNASARSRRGPGGSGSLGLGGLGGLGVLGPRGGGSGSGSGLGSGLGRALPMPLGRMGSTPTQYAQCLTARNESVFVPVSAVGSFYAVATEDTAERDADGDVDDDLSRVYQLPQLLRLTAEPLPVKVQLVCGPIQSPLPTGFTGLLLLEDLQQEDVILACTIPRSWALPCATPTTPATPTPGGDTTTASSTPPSCATNTTATSTTTTSSSSSSSSTTPEEGDSSSKPVFLEMDADSKFLLTRPLASREAEARFFKTPLLRRVLSHCRERADLWSSQIKVTHHVFPFPDSGGGGGPTPAALAPKAASAVASSAPAPAGSTRSTSEHGSSGRAIQGLFRVGGASKDREASALGGRASSLSSGGTKKSQSFRYASPSQAALGGAGGKPPTGATPTTASSSTPTTSSARGTHRGTHQLLQQLQSLPGLKNLLRRTSSVSPSASSPPDVPLSVVFPELFGLPPPSANAEDTSGGCGPGGQDRQDCGGSVKHVMAAGRAAPQTAPQQQQLCFYADELPYGRVADALPATVTPATQPAAKQPPRQQPCPCPRVGRSGRTVTVLGNARGRPLYDEAEEGDEEDEDEDDVEEDDRGDRRQRLSHDDDEENIYAEICECPRRGHGRAQGVVVSGARVILTTACSEERRGYYTFASATSKDQYYTGGSDGTFSGTMSSSNPSNPEEDLYDNVC